MLISQFDQGFTAGFGVGFLGGEAVANKILHLRLCHAMFAHVILFELIELGKLPLPRRVIHE